VTTPSMTERAVGLATALTPTWARAPAPSSEISKHKDAGLIERGLIEPGFIDLGFMDSNWKVPGADSLAAVRVGQ
jgi:hypothetical protein